MNGMGSRWKWSRPRLSRRFLSVRRSGHTRPITSMPPWSGRYRWKRRCGGLFAKLKGLFRGKKQEAAPEKAGRKLTAAERREIRKVIESARGDGKPHSAQDTLPFRQRSEEHTSELQSRFDLVCRLLLEKQKN